MKLIRRHDSSHAPFFPRTFARAFARTVAHALLVALVLVVCAGNDACQLPAAEQPVSTDDPAVNGIATDDRAPAEDPRAELPPAELPPAEEPLAEEPPADLPPGPDPETDLVAVLPSGADLLCVHPEYVDVALAQLAAERLRDGTFLTVLTDEAGAREEVRFALYPTEWPFLCSDAHRAVATGPSPIVDLVGLIPEGRDVLCVHPDHVETVLERLQARSVGDGLWATYGSPELGELLDPVVFGIQETLAPVACGELIADPAGGPVAPVGDVGDGGDVVHPFVGAPPVFVKGRFKVYTNASCNVELPAVSGRCYPLSRREEDGAASWKVHLDAHRICGKGTGFCVEVDSVIGRTEFYLASNCSGGVVRTEAERGDACFVAERDGYGSPGPAEEETDRFRVFKNAACVLSSAALTSRCEEAGSPHGQYARREWRDWHTCVPGTGYCAEGKLVVGIWAWFDQRIGDRCQTRLYEEPIIEFACLP